MEETNNPLMKAMHFRNGKLKRERERESVIRILYNDLSFGISLIRHHCFIPLLANILSQFSSACKAHEEIDYSGYRSYNAMPLERDMIALKDGLHLCPLGTVWTKKDGFFGGDHVLLGTASAMAGVREELVEKKAVTERELKTVAFDGLRPFE